MFASKEPTAYPNPTEPMTMPDTTEHDEPIVTRGLRLPCPKCGDAEARFFLNLDDGETLTCQECDSETTTDELRTMVRQWQRVLTWIDAMPLQSTVDAQ